MFMFFNKDNKFFISSNLLGGNSFFIGNSLFVGNSFEKKPFPRKKQVWEMASRLQENKDCKVARYIKWVYGFKIDNLSR